MADSQLILDLLFLHKRGGCPLAVLLKDYQGLAALPTPISLQGNDNLSTTECSKRRSESMIKIKSIKQSITPC